MPKQSMLSERIRSESAERKSIRKKVEESDIRATEDEGKIFREILSKISTKFRTEISDSGFSSAVKERIQEVVKKECDDLNCDYETKRRIERLVMTNITGLGPIQPYMDDESVTEVVVQKYDNICIERNGLIERIDAAFIDDEHLMTIINRIVQPLGRQINLSVPMVDARLADGSRVNAVIPPVSPDGAMLTIRKFSKRALTGADYVRLGSMSQEMLDFLALCVKGKISLIVSGGTGSGKTTLLNMLSSYIPEDELIITIEDSCELRLHQPNVRRLEARPVVAGQGENFMPVTVQTLVKNALRMRPDRIIVGEIRDDTIVDMMSAMSTGHEGSMSTVHANSPHNLVNSRMRILYSQYEKEFTDDAQSVQISEALNMIVQIQRGVDGKRRITHITHVAGIDEDGMIDLKDIFIYDKDKDTYHATGYVPTSMLTMMRGRDVYVDKEVFTYAD